MNPMGKKLSRMLTDIQPVVVGLGFVDQLQKVFTDWPNYIYQSTQLTKQNYLVKPPTYADDLAFVFNLAAEVLYSIPNLVFVDCKWG